MWLIFGCKRICQHFVQNDINLKYQPEPKIYVLLII